MLSMGGQRIDTRAATGKLMITMLGVIAEFESGLLFERQGEGVRRSCQPFGADSLYGVGTIGDLVQRPKQLGSSARIAMAHRI
jgi:Resolvase, N terminal domain